jgi:hypothetical protein
MCLTPKTSDSPKSHPGSTDCAPCPRLVLASRTTSPGKLDIQNSLACLPSVSSSKFTLFTAVKCHTGFKNCVAFEFYPDQMLFPVLLFQDAEKIAHEYLGKSIFVEWPHLYEAKVESISTSTVK